MKNYKLHVSEGFKDTYGKEMLVKKEIEYRVLHQFKTNGYEHIKTPALEYLDVYSKNGVQKPDLYNLINRQGEVLSLCNDMTSSIARYVCSNNALPSGPKKYCYIADTFRYPRLYQGKNHQFLQAGVEFLGEVGLDADVSVIYLAYKTMKACNIHDFTIHLGSREFLSAVFHDFGIEKATRDMIYSLIDEKDYVSMRSLLEEKVDHEAASFLINLMLKGGRLRYIDALIHDLEAKKSHDVLVYLKKIYMTLQELGVDNVVFDFSIYSYAEYYSGIIFAIYTGGVGKAVVNGGRCDKLFIEFGKDYADCGFGMDLDSLASYCLENNLIAVDKKKYISYANSDAFVKSLKANEALRNDGIIVSELHFASLELALSYAKDNGFDAVIEYTNEGNKVWEVEKC